MHNPQLLPFLILGTLLITALAFTVIVSVVIQKQRQVNNRLARQRLEFEHAQSLLNTRVEVRESTLNMLARELHDNITQALTGCYMQLNTVSGLPEPGAREAMLADTRSHLTGIIRDVRMLSHSLATGMVEERELQEAVQAELNRIERASQIRCVLVPDTLVELPPPQRLLMFRALQEGLQNVLKHADARNIEVRLYTERGNYNVILSDDGIGFDPSALAESTLGMRSIRERLELLNGKLELQSSQGKGTVIHLRVPLPQDDETD